MTLIECFTDAHIDNIAACLRLRPEKLIMVGNREEMAAPVQQYKKILRQRGLHTEISMCDVQGKDFQEICAVFARLVRGQDEYVIDLTGGDEPVIMAVGAVVAGLEPDARRPVRVEKFHHDTGTVRDCINDNRRIPADAVNLTVEELIQLHGGSLHPDTYQPEESYSCRDLDGLWRIVSETPKAWNRAIASLNEFESRSDSRTQVYLPLEHLRSSISNFEEKIEIVRDLLEKLHNHGIIDDFSSRNALEYTYRSPLLRYCTLKAGNVLEVKTLMEGQEILQNGVPFFHDCRTSVSIDWDGIIHPPEEREPETRNEIDVVLMHGTTPLFISCKNGNIGEEELYKLHTVAHWFGGPYARKMLIATNLEQKNPASRSAFIQRAWDMDIFLETDAAELSREEWKNLFLQAMQ